MSPVPNSLTLRVWFVRGMRPAAGRGGRAEILRHQANGIVLHLACGKLNGLVRPCASGRRRLIGMAPR